MSKRSTGFSDEDRHIVLQRSYGKCERCNRRDAGHIHHRKPRRMGGRSGAGAKDVNRPSNALALCPACHDEIETKTRGEAQELGLILSDGQDPAETPVLLPRYRGWVTLADDGNIHWIASRRLTDPQ